MPYVIRKQGNKFCVFKEGGAQIACHPTKREARDQQKALYAQEKADAAKQFTAKERKKAANKGQALKDGGFPIRNAADLKNAIRALGRAKNKAAAKAHIIKRAKALSLTKLLPKEWDVSDKAHGESSLILCPEDGCDRAFVNTDGLFEHAEAVHTFDDIRRTVSEALREKFGRSGDYKASPPLAAIWVWIDDLADDWVVYMVEEGTDSKLFKASYVIDANSNVTFGDPVEVRRRTVYDAVTPAS